MSTPSVYRGRSVEELIPRIEAELGPDAIVLRRRTGLTGGIGGFFQRPFAEVEAQPGGPRVDLYDEAPEEPAMPPPMESRPMVSRPAGAYVTDSLATLTASEPEPLSTQAAEPFTAILAAAEQTLDAAAPELAAPTPTQAPPTPEPAVDFESFEPLRAELRRIDPPAPAPAPTSPEPEHRSRARVSLEGGLVELGMSPEFAAELVDGAGAHVQPFAPRLSLVRAVHRGLVQRIPVVSSPLPVASAAIALVGSGGSGKTSCCAALLGAYRKASTLQASCATIVAGDGPDHDRLSLLLSPAIMTPTALGSTQASRALAEARERGLLLLDTPPLSPADRPGIRRLAGALPEFAPDRVVIALPATLGPRAAAQLLEALAPLGASAVAITHADETDQLGVAVEAACRFGLAPEYILDRGRARGRLTRIDPAYLADRLLPGAA